MQNEEKNNAGDFFQNNRRGIFIFLGLVIAALLGLIVFLAVQDVFLKKGINEVEQFSARITELHLDHDHDEDSMHEYTEAVADEVSELLSEIETFAAKRGRYPAARAWALAGHIYNRRKDWSKSQEVWTKASKAASKTFLAPVAFFNAAAAAEEQGKREEAIALYQGCVSQPMDFPAAPRAQFSIGRLNEELGNKEAAIEAYRVILSTWPSIDVWVNLANSRLAVIEDK